ncbi:MAG: SIS domain-containing protein, partial [Bacilli bacterium]
MHTLLGITKEKLAAQHALATMEEILQQPSVWCQSADQLARHKDAITTFLKGIPSGARYIFTGAGSSAYVGDVCAPWLNERSPLYFESIATTDIVSNPFAYLKKDVPTVLISVGRSGNSPESVGAYDRVEQVVETSYHVIITCNANGALAARGAQNDRAFVVTLPEATHDRGFAMTSSYSTMLLTAVAFFQIHGTEQWLQEVKQIAEAGASFVDENATRIAALAKQNHDRIVYLGSGELAGIAQECALKFLELTAGEQMATHETPLGFRHGPKSLVNEKTCSILCLHRNEYTNQYDTDLLRELNAHRNGDHTVAIGFGQPNEEVNEWFQLPSVAEETKLLPAQALLYVVFG